MPSRDERLDALARSGLRRMRENGETAGAMDQRDRVAMASRSFGTYAGRPLPEVAIERVAKIDGPALGDHRARDVRPADRRRRPPARARRRTRCARPARSSARRFARRGCAASRAARSAAPRARACRAEMQAEDVRLAVALDGAQLDAGNDANAELTPGARAPRRCRRRCRDRSARSPPVRRAARRARRRPAARDPSDAVECDVQVDESPGVARPVSAALTRVVGFRRRVARLRLRRTAARDRRRSTRRASCSRERVPAGE